MPYVNGIWMPEDDSVATQVATLTSQDSPLMRQAATRGAQVANRRGLLNSSLAAQTAQDAVIGAATPIASQDASQIASKNLAVINNNASLAQQRETIASSEKQQRESIAATDRANLLSAGLTANGQYLDAFGQIAGNADIPAASRDAYLTNILAARDAPGTLAKSIYGVDLNWGAPAAAAADGSASAAAPAAAAQGSKSGTLSTIAKTALSPVSTSAGRKLLTTGLLGALL